MPTPEWFAENPKISAYVSKEIDDALKAWMEQNRVKKVSQALTQILNEYLGLVKAPKVIAEGQYATLEQLQELMARVEALEKGSSLKKTKAKSSIKKAEKPEPEITGLLNLEGTSDEGWMLTHEAHEQYASTTNYNTFRMMKPKKMLEKFGLEADPNRKGGRGKNAKPWIRKI